MREVQIRTWCDACAERGEQEAGMTTPELMGGMTLDLCAFHRDELLGGLESLLERSGIRVDGKPRRRAPGPQRGVLVPSDDDWPCPHCDVVKPNDHQLLRHARNEHGGSTLTALFGTSCPLCDFQGAGRLGHHTRKAHGLNVAQAAAAAAARKAS